MGESLSKQEEREYQMFLEEQARRRIEAGSVCVLWKGSLMARLVRVTRRAEPRANNYWYTRPYLDQGYPEKRVHADELTLLENEMEIIAWAVRG